MAFLEWHYVLTLFIIFCVWLFTKIKRFHKQINRKNTRVPDIKILQKIIPPSCSNGWKVKAVCNALPVWIYSTTFTFAPKYLIATRTVLQAKSTRILQELRNVKVFSMIFPDFPPFRQQRSKSDNGDVLHLSNMFSSLSLPNILLSGQQTDLKFERYWSSTSETSWLYVCPTIQLLSSRYFHWICFLITDMDDSSSLLHVLASYPEDVGSGNAHKMITSCQVLIKDHIDSACQDKIKINPSQQQQHLQHANDDEPVSPVKRTVSRNSYHAPKGLVQAAASPVKENFGLVEEPAIIQHFNTPENLNLVHNVSDPKTKSSPTKVVSPEMTPTPRSRPSSRVIEEKTEPKKEPKKKTVKKQKKEVEINKKLEPYQDLISEGYKLMMSVFEADEDTDGWECINRKNDVMVHKKVGTEDFPNDIYKGKTSINVPVAFLMNYLLNMDNKPEYDDVFESGSTVEELGDDMTKIIHLIYKNLWPVTGRDFCSISAPRHVSDNKYGILVKGLTHPGCPEIKSKVRGECILGGYVLEDVSEDVSNITFIVCANFNGYIPSKIVNKVSSDQPLSVGIVRKKVEDRYRKDPGSTEGKDVINKLHIIPSVYPKEEEESEEESEEEPDVHVNGKIEHVVNEPAISLQTEHTPEPSRDEVLSNGSTSVTTKNSVPTIHVSNPDLSIDSGVLQAIEVDTSSGEIDMKEDHYENNSKKLTMRHSLRSDDISVSEDDSENLDDTSSQPSDDSVMYQSSLSVNDPVEYPRDSNGEIDFLSLGNQCAFSLEEEFALTQRINTTIKYDPDKQEKDQWKFQGTHKDVIIMRKVSSKHKFHSFLGRGIINVLPVTIWEMIKNPTTRFVYDSMLKKITTMKEINDHVKIVHMKHETTACFVKQARDFSVMTVEKVKDKKYILCGTSVDVPECPVTPDCVRGTVFSSGWIIEPVLKNGRACSRVTYISQVNFGGRLPSRLVNFIAKRQPLAVAYLRKYLEEAEQ